MVLGGIPLALISAVQESDELIPRLQQLNGEALLALFLSRRAMRPGILKRDVWGGGGGSGPRLAV